MSSKLQELLKNNPKAWEIAFNENGLVELEGEENTQVTIQEAFGTPDAPILFPKVISRTLKEAAEPVALVTPMLDVVRTNGRTMEFPAVNAIQAAHIPEGQEYPEQALVFERQVEGKISKKGVKVVFTDEVIADSQWDIVGLHVRAAGRAMQRLKEQIALGRFKDAATTVFTNVVGAPVTTGRGIDGALNGTMSWDDYISMAAVLHAENHAPTDFIIHPLFWPIFLKSAPYHNVYQPNLAWNTNVGSKEGSAQSAAPLGINVVLSPYVDFNAADGDDPATSDVFLIDRSEIGALLIRDDMSVDEWSDQTRDIRSIKMKERYDIVAFGDGEGITVAANVALTTSYDIQLTNEVTL